MKKKYATWYANRTKIVKPTSTEKIFWFFIFFGDDKFYLKNDQESSSKRKKIKIKFKKNVLASIKSVAPGKHNKTAIAENFN